MLKLWLVCCCAIMMPAIAHSQIPHAPAADLAAVVRAFVREAVVSQPALQASAQNRAAASAGVESAQWQFYPTPSLLAERANQRPSIALNQQTTTLRLQQPLWSGGRLTAQFQKAQAAEWVAEESLGELKLGVAGRVIQQLGEALNACRKLDALTRSRDRHFEYLKLVERRAKDGLSASADVVLAKARYESSRAEVSLQHLQLQVAVSRLQEIVGQEVRLEVLKPVLMAVTEAAIDRRGLQDFQAVVDAVFKQSPALSRARYEVDQAEAEIQVSKSNLKPQLYLRAENVHGDRTGTDNVVYLGVSSSLGAGRSTSTEIAANHLKAQAKRLDIQAKEKEIREQLQADFLQFTLGYERLSFLQASLIESEQVMLATERQFLVGRKSWIDLMNSARETAQAEVQVADALASQWTLFNRLGLQMSGLERYLSSQSLTAVVSP